ncbi:bifunctional ornithine acetyltransferase/N-acetylglutamate synthase [Radiobacillus kanasensis]|uniref:bifunctional ornithine acetyltransferase/N-acetylglutamate synthase n=1 Tax=Radiobacillus kanasensis TaxID=2844358 RepID=UPI001E2DC65D|nr:bifunctional ornithine acetyltransferase/N-acetylglutamate synthase [Radiobacillus kanasensis]UFT99124.1 bifunctional ornithine acetyltransferase/N-acetylglutamate synthase [Radiobacillus kanasensis]
MGQSTIKEKIQIIENGSVTSPKGYQAGGLHCGLRKKKLDLGWIYSEVPAATVGVYTTNVFQAAPLQVTQESLNKENKLQGIIINSAIANACTGDQGLLDAYEMRKTFAEKLGIQEHYAAVASTGLIGEMLPMDKLKQGIAQIGLPEHEGSDKFETAILTTDTKEKAVAVKLWIDDKEITIGGAAKGSGMIHPNMATMLSFVTTDANVDGNSLSTALKQITNKSFNMITVDGDTSTNDMALVMANGKAENNVLTEDHPEWETFYKGLETICQLLAKEIARDGEGATKLVEVKVSGTASNEAAAAISKAIISSNLVKTAIHGADANWGRIITAIGYSGQPLNPNKVGVALGPIPVVENGLPVPFSEEEAKEYLLQDEIVLYATFQDGTGEATAWGCDLSYDYVKINASYRT